MMGQAADGVWLVTGTDNNWVLVAEGDEVTLVPGRLVPVPTPGHTSGHCAFHLPERGVLIAGDALMTAHPAARTTGPQLLPRMFNHDEAAALASLQALAGLSADVVLPGHGPAYPGSPASAVERATAAHH